MKKRVNTVVLAAGGTGGHIFPAESLAERLRQRGVRAVLFTDERFSQYKGALSNLETVKIASAGGGGSLVKRIKSMAKILYGISVARAQLKQLQPKVVVGFGGYPSFPTMFAAQLLKIPTIVHEQNAVMGRANRMVQHKATKIALSFPQTRFLDDASPATVTIVGNPVRSGIKEVALKPYPNLGDHEKLRILVMGGSQGAHVFSDIVPKAIAALPSQLQQRIHIVQQCRRDDIEAVRQHYEALDVPYEVASFFNDIPARLASAHLIIGRSGASTVAELQVAGRPAILVPYPRSADNHQQANASAMAETGGAWVMLQEGFTVQALKEKLEQFFHHPATLQRAAKQLRQLENSDAAERLAQLIDPYTGAVAPVNPQHISSEMANEEVAA